MISKEKQGMVNRERKKKWIRCWCCYSFGERERERREREGEEKVRIKIILKNNI
jgi:hypothetical protein